MNDGEAQAIETGSGDRVEDAPVPRIGGSVTQSPTPNTAKPVSNGEFQHLTPDSPNPHDELVPIGRVRDLQSANDKLRARLGDLERRLVDADGVAETARQALAEARQRELGGLRRALLAEQAGRVVPELVTGDSPEALEASVEVARAAFERATESARARLGAHLVPAGTPTRSGPSSETLTPLAKIAEGLNRA